MFTILEYIQADGRRPFAKWFGALDVQAAAKVTVAVTRLESGNISAVKSVGDGVAEIRIDSGPGYRIYFGREGKTLVILLAGGTKKRQQLDIVAAKVRWSDYKARKRVEGKT